jgi:hypothetical protein
VAEARRRFDDGLSRLLRRLRRAGKQLVCLGRFMVFPPGDRRLLYEANLEAAAGVGGKRAREEEKGSGSGLVFPEEQRFEERLLGGLALADAYRACHPQGVHGSRTMRA